jgi:dihydropteroate synthase
MTSVAAGQRIEPRNRRCEVWGVLNVTPDSFSDGGAYLRFDDAVRHGRRMLAEGADVIDVGGASSRPRGTAYGAGAEPVSPAEECARVVTVVEALARELRAKVSIDTTAAEVACAAIAAGATVVNDVSCGRHPALLRVVADTDAQYVLMHTRGRGEVQPPNTSYGDLVREVRDEILAGVERALRAGVRRDRIWIDPGIGFAKTAEQSLRLLAHMDAFVALGFPVLVGPSRKAFVAESAPRPDGTRPPPSERLGGTLAAVTVAVQAGAAAIRAHDVAATVQATQLALALREARVRATWSEEPS